MQNSPRNNTETVRAEVPDVISLYELAEQRDIDVYWYSMDSDLESLVAEIVPGHTAIAIDPFKLKSLGDEKYKLAHELGHSLTGSLYRRNTPLDERGRNEQRADRWAIEHLLPFSALDQAIAAGHGTPSELAELFDLPQYFVEMAIAYYTGPKALTFTGK